MTDLPPAHNSSAPTGSAPWKRWALPVALLLIVAAGSGFVVYRLTSFEEHLVQMSRTMEQTLKKAEQAAEDAREAQTQAARAAQGRQAAEEEASQAEQARFEAESAAEEAERDARQARQEAEQVRREREEELSRLQGALSQIAETRRTALGLVMNLGSDSMQFDFNKANLRWENKELLSRIAGILLTSQDYAIYVYGHTDDIGDAEYNQRLSENRAQSVRNYLVEAGIDADLITTKGYGKSRPIVAGTTPEARAKNRRVEIGIVNTSVQYQKAQSQ